MVNYQTHLDKILSSSTEINIWRDGVISENIIFPKIIQLRFYSFFVNP